MKIVKTIAAILVSLTSAVQECNDVNCIIQLTQPDEEVFCGCTTTSCEIQLLNADYKGFTLVSYATNTKMQCDGVDSCQDASVHVGIDPDDIPFTIETNLTNVVCNPLKLEADCDGSSGCEGMFIEAIDVDVTVRSRAIDAFEMGELSCNATDISNPPICKLLCGNNINAPSCRESICENICECEGMNCPGYVQPTTVVQTTLPAPPVEAPIVLPSYMRCTPETTIAGICTLSPKGGDIIVVTKSDNIIELLVLCEDNEQCKKDNGALVIYSFAKSTLVKCGKSEQSYQSCEGLQLYAGKLTKEEVPLGFKKSDFSGVIDKVIVEINGKDCAKESNLTVNGPIQEDPRILVLGESSFEGSQTKCSLNGPRTCLLACSPDAVQGCRNSLCLGDCTITNDTSIPSGPRMAGVNSRMSQSSGTTTVPGAKGATIVLPNTEDKCIIDCSGNGQCLKDGNVFKVHSGCNETILNCGYSACKEAIINIGELTTNLPPNTNAASFSGEKSKFVMNCAYAGCQSTVVNVVGNVFETVINALEPNALKGATVNCQSGGCVYECNNGDSCEQLLSVCPADDPCLCNGGSCTSLNLNSENTNVTTDAPTIKTVFPTGSPSMKPSASPSRSPTLSGSIVYTPDTSNPDIDNKVVCKDNVGECIIDCNNIGQRCDGGLTVLSAANDTSIQCDKDDACKDLRVYIGESITQTVLFSLNLLSRGLTVDDFTGEIKSVNVNCTGKSACYKAQIRATAEVEEIIEIETNSAQDALKDSIVDIELIGNNGICTINCDTGVCNNLNIISDECNCIGSSCPMMRIASVNAIPKDNLNKNDFSNNRSHYPTFLPTAIIVCITFAMVCLLSFCVYYKYFTKEENKISLIKNNPYDTFNTNTQALEMENYV